MRIDFFIDSMGPGGAERVTSLLVNRWASQGHDVRLITLADPSDDHYSLEATIDRVMLGLLGPARSGAHGLVLNARRVIRIARLLRTGRPDAVVSFASRMNVLVLVAARLSGDPRVVVSERSNPGVHPVPCTIDRGRRWLYRRASAVVAQTEGAAAWIDEHCPGATIAVIPNPVSALPFVAESDPNLIVAAGRLGPEKGFDLLLEAMVEVSRRLPNARLRICGEGPLRPELEDQIQALGLTQTVELVGTYTDAAVAIGGAAAFVLSSRYEGFPNVVVEAMALGTPVISFDCPYGPAELIRDRHDGLLIPPEDVLGLATALISVLENTAVRRSMRQNAARRGRQFSLAQIGIQWDGLVGQ